MARLGISVLSISALSAGVLAVAPFDANPLSVAANSANPGVVYQMRITDYTESPAAVYNAETMAEGVNYKMSMTGGPRGGLFEIIFKGLRRELFMVSHEDSSYVVMNEETIARLAGMFAQVATMMESMPEAQRNAMMKARGMGGAEPTELRNTGERATKHGYPCVKYEVVRGDHVIREMWVTDWKNLDGGDEASAAFEELASFFREMMESFKGFGPMAEMGGQFDKMKEMNGMPVESKEFGDDGALTGEATLESAVRRTIGDEEFDAPSGYKRQDMGKGF